MIFCNKCFADSEVRFIIEGIGKRSDHCETCGQRDVFLYDTEINFELTDMFEELVNIYTPAHLLPETFPKGNLKMLKDELVENWHIFHPHLSRAKVYDIIKNICMEDYTANSELFDAPIGISERYDEVALSEHSLLKNYSWDEFVSSLKHHNRFHSQHMNLDLFEKFCSFIRKGYKKGAIFYRARIAPETGYPVEQMGAPSEEFAVPGRANSAGIRCFYLTSGESTAIHEVRAGVFDYVTVAKFELQEDIVVIDLKAIDRISPFISEFDYLEHALNKDHLHRINAEMGKALRRSDSVLDYLPTQYISDFIKSIQYGDKPEYAGIEYNSTIDSDGVNFALFEPFPMLKCIEINTYRISEIQYRKDKV